MPEKRLPQTIAKQFLANEDSIDLSTLTVLARRSLFRIGNRRQLPSPQNNTHTQTHHSSQTICGGRSVKR